MIYKNIINMLKIEINGSNYNIGDFLPSEKELAKQYAISRNTLRKALKELEDDGWIERRHGSGSWIKKKYFQTATNRSDSFSFTQIVNSENKTPSSQVLKFELQYASEEISKMLQLLPGEPVYYVKRLRLINNIPIQLEESWMSATRFPELSFSHVLQSKYSYIEDKCGVKIKGSYQSVLAINPSVELATILRTSTQDPIIKMYTQAVDEEDHPIDYSILYTNMYEFQIKYYFPRNFSAEGNTFIE